MIERYSDHAANERTFLAWVRTAIAIMAFGFLVQKFDLFLRIANQSLDARSTSAGSQIVGNIAGLLLILLGGVVMPFAAIRFRKTTRDIDSKEVQPGAGGAAGYHLRPARPPDRPRRRRPAPDAHGPGRQGRVACRQLQGRALQPAERRHLSLERVSVFHRSGQASSLPRT